jgi:AcrR family transcriptional regulator
VWFSPVSGFFEICRTLGRQPVDQEQIERFRARAIEAAWKVFERGGLRAVSTRAIAKELGCSPMTAYRYFENHEALINDLRGEAFDRFAAVLRAADDRAKDEIERISRISRAYVEYGLSNKETYQLMFAHPAAIENGLSMMRLLAASRRAFSAIHDVFVAAVDAGSVKGEPLIEAHRQWVRVHGIVTLAIAGKLVFGLSVDDLVDIEFGHRDDT